MTDFINNFVNVALGRLVSGETSETADRSHVQKAAKKFKIKKSMSKPEVSYKWMAKLSAGKK